MHMYISMGPRHETGRAQHVIPLVILKIKAGGGAMRLSHGFGQLTLSGIVLDEVEVLQCRWPWFSNASVENGLNLHGTRPRKAERTQTPPLHTK